MRISNTLPEFKQELSLYITVTGQARRAYRGVLSPKQRALLTYGYCLIARGEYSQCKLLRAKRRLQIS